MSEPVSIAIVGPTASGKTALSIEVAQRLAGEIISMDSRQLYRGMDIGTAKPSRTQRHAVPHHGLDIVDPSERFSAGRFARLARGWIDEIQSRGHVPILVGGTGFFLRALTNPIFREPELDPARREALQAYLDALDPDALHEWLAALDAETARRLSSGGGRQRILRALEMALLTGHPLSWWHRNAPSEAPPLLPRIFVLEPPREALLRAIDDRVYAMIRGGLLDEVRGLRDRGYGAADPGMNATGYAELLPVLAGDVHLEDAAEAIRKNTRAYARRQLTWLRHQLPDDAVWMDPGEGIESLADRIEREWREFAGTEEGPAASRSDQRHQPSRRRNAE